MKDRFMLLYANGCSMTYGSELFDDPATGKCRDNALRQKVAWPGRLKELLELDEVVNDAVPSGSNERIVRTTIAWVAKNYIIPRKNLHDLLVVVGWSGAMRREFHVNGIWQQVIPYQKHADEDLQELVEVYKRRAWNKTEESARFITLLLSLQAFLECHGISYLFFDAIESCNVVFASGGEDARTLSSLVRGGNYYNFEAIDGSMAGVLERESPKWNGRHPGEDGHRLWAAKLGRFILEANIGGKWPEEIWTRTLGVSIPSQVSTAIPKSRERPWVYP